MARFVHTSVLTSVAGLSTSLRLSLLLGKWNSPKSFKCEWDMTDWVWFMKPSNRICHVTCISPPCSSVAWQPQTAKPQKVSLVLASKRWCDCHHLRWALTGTVAKRVVYCKITWTPLSKYSSEESGETKDARQALQFKQMLLTGLVFPMLMWCNSASLKIQFMYKDTFSSIP